MGRRTRCQALSPALPARRGFPSSTSCARRGRRGDTGRGERLLIVLESADQTFAAAVILQPQLPATLSRAIQRVLGTVLGGALALAGARLLWPMSERELFPNTAAEVLDDVRALASSPASLEAFAGAVEAEIAELRSAIVEARAPREAADVAGAAGAAGDGPALRSRMEHVAQQVTMQRGSVARWMAPEG